MGGVSAIMLGFAYLAVAGGTCALGHGLAGKSPAGRKAVPIVAALWPLGVFLLAAIAVLALVDALIAQATGWMVPPGEDR